LYKLSIRGCPPGSLMAMMCLCVPCNCLAINRGSPRQEGDWEHLPHGSWPETRASLSQRVILSGENKKMKERRRKSKGKAEPKRRQSAGKVKNGSQRKFNLPLQCWNSSLSKRSASNSFLWLKSSKLEQQKFNSIAATCMHTYIMSCPRKVCYGKLFLATDNQIAKEREGRPKVESWEAPRIERCISTERKSLLLNSGQPKI